MRAINDKEKRAKRTVHRALALLFSMLVLFTIALLPGDDTAAETKLKAAIPGLCYDCHKDLKQGLSSPHVHPLFREGRCITCHNSHVSREKGLMVDTVNAVCLDCHEGIRKLLDSAVVHSPVRSEACTICHSPHSSRNSHLLVRGEKELCLKCHAGVKEQMNQQFTCAPFRNGECSECHNAHASGRGALMVSPAGKLCQKCHAPRCRAGDVSIASEVAGTDCTSCHSGHGSGQKGILGPYGHKAFIQQNCGECHNPAGPGKKMTTKKQGDELCFLCHRNDGSEYRYFASDVHIKGAANVCSLCHDHHASESRELTKSETGICVRCHERTEKNTASMERILPAVRCAPIKNRKCFECHVPVHSDRPLNFPDDSIEMCARCHRAQHQITHPMGEEVIDVRDGKPVTCLSCHSMHNSRYAFMLTHDKERELCIQCHKM